MQNQQATRLSLFVIAAVLGAAFLALLEFVYASLGAGGGLWLLLSLLGLYLPLGAVFGLGLGVLWTAATKSFGGPPVALLRDGLRALCQDPEADRQRASWIVAAAVSVLTAALVPGVMFFVANKFENTTLAAIFLSLSSVAGSLLGLVLAPVFQLVSGLVFRIIPGGGARVPRRTSFALFVVFVLPVLLGGVLALTRFSEVDSNPLFFGLGLLLLTALLVGVLPNRRGPAPVAAAVVLCLVSGMALFATAVTLEEHRPLPKTLAEETLFAKRLLGMARSLSDRDKDGLSALFDGGDCDDRDAAVFPGAKEIPGNGKDDNCLNGDAPITQASQGQPSAPATPDSAPAGPALPKMNFVFIVVDTLRADRLGAYGYSRPTSPRMDAFAAQGVRFANAYSQAPHTPRSFPSFLTSRLSSQVKWVKEFANYPEMLDENYTFFELLKDAGYRTVAVASHHYFKPERKVDQGIDNFINDSPDTIADSNKVSKSPMIVPRAVQELNTLAKDGKPFALWVHVFEPHSSYIVHPEAPDFGKSLSDKYDNEIAFTDKYIGDLIDAVDAAGLKENTAVILFSDHGEGFGEHNKFYFHGQSLYDEVMHVPLIIRGPGIAPRVVKERVALLDLFPTVAALAHAKAPEGLAGWSLLPALLGQALTGSEERVIAAELLPYPNLNERHLAVYKGKYKLYHKVTQNIFELYDLESDPGETKNLYEPGSPITSSMMQLLESF